MVKTKTERRLSKLNLFKKKKTAEEKREEFLRLEKLRDDNLMKQMKIIEEMDKKKNPFYEINSRSLYDKKDLFELEKKTVFEEEESEGREDEKKKSEEEEEEEEELEDILGSSDEEDNDEALKKEEEVEGEEEEGEGEKEEEEKEKDGEKDFSKLPEKVKEFVFKACSKFKKKKDRESFRKKINKELSSHMKIYNTCSSTCVDGTAKLWKASKNYIKALNLTIQATRNMMNRIKKLRKFSNEVVRCEFRLRKLRLFVDGMERNRETIVCENLLHVFNEINEIHETLETLLTSISGFKKGVKKKSKVLKGLVVSGVSASGVLLCGGGVTSVLGVGAFIGTIATSGLSLPVLLALCALSGIGFGGGIGCSFVSGNGILLLSAAGAIEKISSSYSLKRAKKLKKRVNQMKHKKGLIWKDVMELMKCVRAAEMDKLRAQKFVNEILMKFNKEQEAEKEEKKKGLN